MSTPDGLSASQDQMGISIMQIYTKQIVSPSYKTSSELGIGWGAGMINICITFPLNKMIFRQQLHGVTAGIAVRQLLSEGPAKLYRGVLPPLFQKTGSVAIMFASFEQIKHGLYLQQPELSLRHPLTTICLAGALAGFCEATLMPFERVQTLLQDPAHMQKFKNTKEAFSRLLADHGVREYYRGLSTILFRNGASNALFFSLRTPISLYSQELGAPKPLSDFFSGALLGCVISTVMYPLNTVKTHMQKHVGGPFRGPTRTLIRIWNNRGRDFRLLFRGVHLNCMRAFISWGIINMSYEQLKGLFVAR